MALIGSVVNQGSMQGQINEANGNLTGLISSAELIGGQVVGMRGLKGDKGDQGDPGADGQDGADGFSPIANVSKVGDTATITITDSLGTTTATVEDGADGQDGADGHSPVITANKVGKVTTVYVDGVAIATINDGQDGGGSSVFIAEYGVTTYADVKDAYDEDAITICTVDDSGNTVICQLAYYDDANGLFYFAQPQSDGFYLAIIASDDTWDDSYFQFASTDTATQLRNGLMDALDKQKLDGIASGAEVNVQSDWNQSVNTADDYIKNKPTIPTVSGLLDVFYPIGSYYETSDTSFDPNVSWGGTWSLETEGLVHIGAGANYTIGDVGGEASHTLTQSESGLPSHGHGFTRPTVDSGGGGHSHTVTVKYRNAVPTNGSSAQPWADGTLSSTGTATIANNTGTHSHTLSGGSVSDNNGADASSPHNNMQPYVVVNRWHRTA